MMTHHTPSACVILPPSAAPAPRTPLQASLHRCSPATLAAALRFRDTGDSASLPVIVHGVLERFVDRRHRSLLRDAPATLRLADDLAIDSLTKMEIVLLLEDALQISVENSDLPDFETLGELRAIIECKLRALPPPADPDAYAQAARWARESIPTPSTPPASSPAHL